jgi:hypothetical protein
VVDGELIQQDPPPLTPEEIDEMEAAKKTAMEREAAIEFMIGLMEAYNNG